MAGYSIRPLNHVIETVRVTAMRRQMNARAAYLEIGDRSGGIPPTRIRAWLNGEYRLTPGRLARLAVAISTWLGDEQYPVEVVVRLLRQARATWIEHEKAKLAEMDGEWFQQAMAFYLGRVPTPEFAATNGTVEPPIEEQGEE